MDGSQGGDEDMLDEKLEQESFNSRNQAGHPDSHLNDINSKNSKGKQLKTF
jgi:hypothetical protein